MAKTSSIHRNLKRIKLSKKNSKKRKKLKDIISITNEPLVSVDFNHSSFSSNFDTTQTKVINKKLCRVLSWYDNEWGFASRLVDLAKYIA